MLCDVVAPCAQYLRFRILYRNGVGVLCVGDGKAIGDRGSFFKDPCEEFGFQKLE